MINLLAGMDSLGSHIHNPTIRYFFRVLSNSIFRRMNNNKVNSKELFFMHCICIHGWKINASTFILQHIEALCARGTTSFCIGGLVPSIEIALDLGGRLKNLASLPPLFMDIDKFHTDRLTKNREAGKYNLMCEIEKFRVLLCLISHSPM